MAKYFEPAGAVSWDVSMTATKPDWRVALKPGDTLNVSATYDTSKASWYESMGIMVVFYADGTRRRPRTRSASKVDRTGLLTHGHLPRTTPRRQAAPGLPGRPQAAERGLQHEPGHQGLPVRAR